MTNDDGVNAPGLEAARRALEGLGRVVVVAPTEERSGASHSLSLTHPVRIEHLESDRYATTGTPVDCVILGFRKILERLPDLVVSGMNHGADQSQWMVAPESDYEGILGGHISITPMHLVQTDYQTLANLQQLELGALDSLESSK